MQINHFPSGRKPRLGLTKASVSTGLESALRSLQGQSRGLQGEADPALCLANRLDKLPSSISPSSALSLPPPHSGPGKGQGLPCLFLSPL